MTFCCRNDNASCRHGSCSKCPCRRGLQIFLLVLIIIGIGLLCTQNLWVSSFVNYLLSLGF